MNDVPDSTTAQWSSRFAFLMAAIGSSVGLGNLWRFSAQAGDNGGGAFILVYVLCILFVGIPVLICEYVIGRSGQGASAVNSVRDIAVNSGASQRWTGLAWLGTTSAFLIVSFYCVVAAWVMIYITRFLSGAFDDQSAEQIAVQFDVVRVNRPLVLAYVTGFLALTVLFVSRGVNKGIELASKVLMPFFFVLLVGLAIFSQTIGFGQSALMADGSAGTGASRAFEFMFSPDFSKIDTDVVVSALGQAFFSIGLGTATMITYGSYLTRDIDIPRSALVIGLTDTGVALIAGLAIFPIVFAFDLDAAGGAGLFFKTLPVALASIPNGAFMGAAFFSLAFFAALTTSIALFEVTTAFARDRFNVARTKAALIVGGLSWLLALGSIYSSEFMTVLDEKITGAVMVPLCGLLTVLFVGWKMNSELLNAELDGLSAGVRKILLFLVKVVAPILVAVVLVAQILASYGH